MADSNETLAALVIRHLVDIAAGRCSITEDDILACRHDEDSTRAEILTGLLYLHQDLAYREQLRQKLSQEQAARKQAEAANRLKDEFIATVSHELRTPLTAIVGWVAILRSGRADSAETKRALEVIDRNVRSQAQLIEDLLDISRITTGKLRLEVGPVEPASIIMTAVESLQLLADTRQIRIQPILDSSAGPVAGDSERLRQVVWNLLSNAIKFTPKGGHVQIVLRRVQSHIEIHVIDTGQGIKPEFLPYIFESFTQADGSLTRKHSGLGIGLAIVKAIVELHGGTIGATSNGEGQGATFSVTLPLMPVTPEDDSEQRISPQDWKEIPLEWQSKIRGLKILVLDDESDSCDVVRCVLELCDAVVRTATSGETALHILRDWHPDVMICDIGMPDMDGYDFIRRVRAYNDDEQQRVRKIPAIALTAFARMEDRVKALAAGYQIHVAKPVDPRELLTIVASLSGFAIRH